MPNDRPAKADVPVDELAGRQQVVPLGSTDQLVVPGMFDSDEELDEFLADFHAQRRGQPSSGAGPAVYGGEEPPAD